MAKKLTISSPHKGTYQDELVPAALEPDYIAMDERSDSSMLAYCVHVAKTLIYYDADNVEDGTWDTFLCADPVMLSAVIAETNSNARYDHFLQLSNALRSDKHSPGDYEDFFYAAVFETVLQIDEWLKLASQNFQPNYLGAFLESSIAERGARWLAMFYGCFKVAQRSANHRKSDELSKKLCHLSSCWGFNPDPHTSEVTEVNVLSAIEYGQHLFILFSEIVAQGKVTFQKARSGNNIPAHIGLLLTFLDLFAPVRGAMNSLTRKHLLFYYQEVLKGKFTDAIPDCAVLLVQLAKGVDQFEMLSGTKFTTASKLVYESVLSQTITSTRIVDCKTVTLVTNGKSCYDNGVFAGSVHEFNTTTDRYWPLFGGTESVHQLHIREDEIGFAFSCADLLLAQGTREVNLVFALDRVPEKMLMTDDGAAYWDMALTTAQGWHRVAPSEVTFSAEPPEMTVQVLLTGSDPAITCYSEKAHGSGFDTPWPICKLILSNEAFSNYHVLSKIVIRGLRIKTAVTGIHNVLLENDGGKLAADLPFIPFPSSMPGANLYVGGQEFFVKPLTSFSVLVTWANLPPSGLQSYYATYNDYYADRSDGSKPPVFQNQSFSAAVFLLDQDFWVPLSGKYGNPRKYKLFTDEHAPATDIRGSSSNMEWPYTARGEKSVHVTLDNASYPFDPFMPDLKGLSNTLQRGFFCITLTGPEQGFGKEDYPNIVSNVALRNSEITIQNARWYHFHKHCLMEIPAVPFVPKVRGIEVSYTSDHSYSLTEDSEIFQWYHLHPLNATQRLSLDDHPTLLPVYDDTCTTYLALDTIYPGTVLSIYFHLEYHIKEIEGDVSQGPAFSYLSLNGWKPLALLSDQTHEFKCSGIIRFVVPSDLCKESMGMPSSAYWIKFGTSTPYPVLISFLSSQAIEVKQVSCTSSVGVTPAFSIDQPVTPIPQIKTILQPAASYGGRSAESEREFISRMAITTGYKNRTITPADIEAIVLSKFPALFQVNAKYDSVQNVVKVALIPWTNHDDENFYLPVASVNMLLEAFDLLKVNSFPGIRYRVGNATVVQLRVKCCVTFVKNNEGERYATRLNDELRLYLSPWVRNNPISAIRTQPTTSAVYAFIQSRPYVEYVESIQFDYLSDSYSYQGADQLQTADDTLIASVETHQINWTGKNKNNEIALETEGVRIGETFFMTN